VFVLALEPLAGLRVVARPGALDAATWEGDGPITVLRVAPDEALAIGASDVEVDDEHAIVEPEPGFSAARLNSAGIASVLAHVEFRLPADRPALAQGKVAGVPVKLLLDGDGAVLVVQTAYIADLEARLR
jgi:hypothetical protein